MNIIMVLNMFDKALFFGPHVAFSKGCACIHQNIFDIPCPFCASLDTKWKQSKSHTNTFTDYLNGSVVTLTFDLPRYIFKCYHCGISCSVKFLFDYLLDHSRFTLHFFLSLMQQRYNNNQKIDYLLSHFEISRNTFFQWNSVFAADLLNLSPILDSHHISISQFLGEKAPVSPLLLEFALRHHRLVFHRQNVENLCLYLETCYIRPDVAQTGQVYRIY